MVYRYTKDDVRFITPLFDQGYTITEINLKYGLYRHKQGTATEKGDYTNFISQMSPRSKHRVKKMSSVYEYSEKAAVIYKIQDCMKCTSKQATQIYNTRIKPLCPTRFTDESGSHLISIRYYALACNSRLYYMWTTNDYAEVMGIEADETNNIWTYRSASEFKDICDGSVTYSDIMFELNAEALGEYEPILVNVCIQKI